MPQKSGRKRTQPTKMEGRSLKIKPREGAGVWNREEIVLYSLPMGDKRCKAFLSGFGWPRAGPSLLDMTFKICFSLRKGTETWAEVLKINLFGLRIEV